jgi:hypothetical protein
LNKDFYKSNANYKDLVDFNHPTLTSLSNTDIPTLLGGSTITKGGEDILNPD